MSASAEHKLLAAVLATRIHARKPCPAPTAGGCLTQPLTTAVVQARAMPATQVQPTSPQPLAAGPALQEQAHRSLVTGECHARHVAKSVEGRHHGQHVHAKRNLLLVGHEAALARGCCPPLLLQLRGGNVRQRAASGCEKQTSLVWSADMHALSGWAQPAAFESAAGTQPTQDDAAPTIPRPPPRQHTAAPPVHPTQLPPAQNIARCPHLRHIRHDGVILLLLQPNLPPPSTASSQRIARCPHLRHIRHHGIILLLLQPRFELFKPLD